MNDEEFSALAESVTQAEQAYSMYGMRNVYGLDAAARERAHVQYNEALVRYVALRSTLRAELNRRAVAEVDAALAIAKAQGRGNR